MVLAVDVVVVILPEGDATTVVRQGISQGLVAPPAAVQREVQIMVLASVLHILALMGPEYATPLELMNHKNGCFPRGQR